MRKKMSALLLGILLLALTACGASGSPETAADASAVRSYSSAGGSAGTAQMAMENGAYDTGFESGEAMEVKTASEAAGESIPQAAAGRKLIRTVNMSVETREYDQLLTALETQIEALGGYIENMDAYNGSVYSGNRSARSAYLCIRIPQDQLEEFLNKVTDISNVIRRSDSTEDVTLQYVDLESHRNALRTEQDRLLELMEQAETIEDIITIEERLSSIRYQLESMESQLRTLDNQVSYSTVYLDISEVKELTPVSEETTLERITNGFLNSLKNVGRDIAETGIWLIIKLPYLVVWAVILIIGFLMIRMLRRSRRRKRIAANTVNGSTDTASAATASREVKNTGSGETQKENGEDHE